MSRETSLDMCRICQNVSLSSLSAPALVKHMSGHILHDPALIGAETPCGFCLSTGSICDISLIVTSKNTTIDMKSSKCPHLRKLALGAASKFNATSSPCTNHPTICPLCVPVSISKPKAVWKYNLRAHIIKVHGTANPDLYTKHFAITEEERILMKAAFKTKPRQSQKKKTSTLTTSDAHSTRLALR